ncbi:hypothetical protein CHARACLAT_019164 [Characodon lateralis]|uniref:Uncharacterized protein n=1 Tax=Characodon lateralis TaxID=208331 RepID=A0ABU7CZ04_9TELE|nr:hypothetical protein [Characodon lateralis]
MSLITVSPGYSSPKRHEGAATRIVMTKGADVGRYYNQGDATSGKLKTRLNIIINVEAGCVQTEEKACGSVAEMFHTPVSSSCTFTGFFCPISTPGRSQMNKLKAGVLTFLS